MGVIGFVLTGLWVKLIHNPTDHPRMTQEELKFISENGAVVDMDHKSPAARRPADLNCTISSSC